MVDLKSVVDAGLVVVGSMTVLGMGLWMLGSESSTVSTSETRRDLHSHLKAA